MNINEYLEMIHKIRPRITRIICADGFDVSIQASQAHYCMPQTNNGPYLKVEIGYPSDKISEWMKYAESPDNPLSTIYGWIPVEIVDAVLKQHGGIVSCVE